MTIVKKQMMIMLSMLLLLSGLSLPIGQRNVTEVQASLTPTLSVGDYITFGTYLDAPIKWRVINLDVNGNPLLLSDKIVTLKAYDSAGAYHQSTRASLGSSYYPDSNIHQWLNSADASITWTQNPPNANNVFQAYNPYDTEKGFLANGNFTSAERAMILPYDLKAVLASTDVGLKDGGSVQYEVVGAGFGSTPFSNASTAYYKNLTSQVFLPTMEMLNDYVYTRGWEVKAKPTAQAAANHTSQIPYFSKDNFLAYLTSSASSANSGDYVYTVTDKVWNPADTDYVSTGPNLGFRGIRPATQLDKTKLSFTGGTGTEADPFIVDDSGGTGVDLRPPTIPTGLTKSEVTRTGFTLDWDVSKDSVGVTGYEIYNGATLVDTVINGSTYYATGLTPGTTYSFTVKAKDAAGNVSGASAPLTVTTQAALGSVNIGDYVEFGSYYNEPILWRVIHKDGNGDPVLFANQQISMKTFDAKGSYHSADINRSFAGSNYYPDSNIRQWLNSQDQSITWTQNVPNATNIMFGYNAYDNEKGFLAEGNFNATERAVIKPLTHKVVLDASDSAKAEGGSAAYTPNSVLANVVQNYDTTAYYKMVTDDVFLLSVKQLKEWVYDNRNILGNNYHISKPTAAAVAKNNFPHYNPQFNNTYWLSTPNFATPAVSSVDAIGNITAGFAGMMGQNGVRPGTMLDMSEVKMGQGTGTAEDPYVVSKGNVSTVAPTDISLSNTVVAENRPIGTVVGVLSATDEDEGDQFSYSLVDADEVENTDNDSFTVVGKTLKTAENFDYDEQSSYKVLIRVADSGGLTYEKEFIITVDEANVKLSRNNKVITLTYKEPIFNGSTASSASGKGIALKAAVKLSKNADAEIPTFSSLSKADVVTVRKNKLIIRLGSPLTTVYNQVEVAADALKDTMGNLSAKSVSDTFTADLSGPKITRVRVGGGNKVIRLRFDEPVFALTKTVKNSVQLSTNGATFSALPETASVSVKRFAMKIVLPEPLTGSNNRIRILKDAIRDTALNKNYELTSNLILVDESAPQLVSASVSGLNKVITLAWNESIKNKSVAPDKKIVLRNAVQLATNGTTFEALPGTAKVDVSKRGLTIVLPTALQGDTNKIKVSAGAVSDLLVTTNTEIETGALVLDKKKPTILSSTVSSDNKVVTLTFSEPVVNAATGTDNAKATALRTAVQYAVNGNSFVALPDTAKLKLSGNKLTVTFVEELTGSSTKIQIGANAIKDNLNNSNELLTSATLSADELKPTISKVELSADNKIVTLTLSESVVGTATGTTAVKAEALKAAVRYAVNGTTFGDLPDKPTLTLKGNVLTVKLTNAITGSATKLRINSGTIVDAAGNTNDELTSASIPADIIPPALKN